MAPNELLTPPTTELSIHEDTIESPDQMVAANHIETATPPKRKGGRKPIYATTEERKQRNRQAQAAFRERRTEYIKQLEITMKENEDTLQGLRQSHREAVDQCHMLRYKTSLLEELLEDHGIDYRAELQTRSNRSMFGQPRPEQLSPRSKHRAPALAVKRSGSAGDGAQAQRPRQRPKIVSRYSIDSPHPSAGSPSSFSFPSLESDAPGVDSPDGIDSGQSQANGYSPHQHPHPPHHNRLPALPFPNESFSHHPGIYGHPAPPAGGFQYSHETYRLPHVPMSSDRLDQESVSRSTPDSHPAATPVSQASEPPSNGNAIASTDEAQRKANMRESMLRADLMSLFEGVDQDTPISADDIYVQGLNVGTLMNDYGLDDLRFRKSFGTRPF